MSGDVVVWMVGAGEAGLSQVIRKHTRPQFGKRLKALYVARHGAEPKRVPRTINGTTQQVFGYVRRDVPLFDETFDAMGLVRS